MKKTWNVLVALLLLALAPAMQAQFTYTTNSDNTLTLSAYSGGGGPVVIPPTFAGLTVADIGTNVFASQPVTSVTMPDTILSIGSLAFSECTALTNLVMSESLTNIGNGAFGFCNALTSLTIPNSVISIQDFAFIFSTNLINVTIPPGVAFLGQAVFQDCIGLTNVTISQGVPMLGNEDFVSCGKLRNITIPGSVTNIGAGVFQNCTALSRATFSPGVPYVGNGMFEACSELNSVSLPSSITNIEPYAFSGTALVNVTLPSNLLVIDNYAFAASALTNITLPNGLLTIGNGAFSGTDANSASIPASVTSIGAEAWVFCQNLTNITVAPLNTSYSSLNRVLFDIGQDTLIEFPGGLHGSYLIPASVDNIAEGAFAACDLVSVMIDSGVTNIGNSAFYSSPNLQSLLFDGNAPVTDPTAFDGDNKATIYYLPGTTGWSSPFAGLPAVLAEAVTWPAPAPISYGSALTTAQLNANVNVPGTLVYNPPLGTVLNAGTNVLSLVFSPSNTSYFIVVTNTVNLIVSPDSLVITANSTTKNYGNTLTIAETEFTSLGLVNGDAITNLILSSLGAAPGATVTGSPYAIVPSGAMPSSLANNYTITYVNGQLTVLPVPLTITANNTNKVYGSTVTFTGTEFAVSGLVNGDMVSGVTLASSGAPASAQVSGSPYTITASAAMPFSLTNNYTISYNSGLLTVNPASLIITASNISKAYGRTVTFAGTEFTASGLANGDSLTSVTLASTGAAASAPVSGSPYAIVPSAAQPSSLTNNYSIAYDNGQLTVSTVPLTITANNTNKTYGTKLTFAGTEFTAAGLLNGDTITSVTLTSAGTPASASLSGSPYPIAPSSALPGSVVSNYSVTYAGGFLTVNPASLTVASGLTANDKYYDETTAATLASNNVVLSGVANGDNVSLNTNGYTATFARAGLGSNIAVTVGGLALSGTGATNYTFTQPAGLTASILAPSLQITHMKPNVILSWPTNASVFVLEGAPSLAPSAIWTPITTGITVNATSNTVTLSPSGINQYFELVAP